MSRNNVKANGFKNHTRSSFVLRVIYSIMVPAIAVITLIGTIQKWGYHKELLLAENQGTIGLAKIVDYTSCDNRPGGRNSSRLSFKVSIGDEIYKVYESRSKCTLFKKEKTMEVLFKRGNKYAFSTNYRRDPDNYVLLPLIIMSFLVLVWYLIRVMKKKSIVIFLVALGFLRNSLEFL